MAENVILRNSDKEILRGEKDDSDFSDYSTRRSQIRTRVRNRSQALAEELELLDEAEETELADQLRKLILEQSSMAPRSELEARIEQFESDLRQIERQCSEVEQLKTDLDEIREQLNAVEQS